MDKRDHIVARCLWSTSFDNQRMAHALQEKLSEWSNESLRDQIQKVLEEHCPVSQTWRINALTIDLGSIEFEKLQQELNLKFPQRFSSALKDLILKRQINNQVIEVVEEAGTWIDLMNEFLQRGTMPWWYTIQQGSARQIFESLLNTQSTHLVVLVKRIGQQRTVRKRIVWQMGEPLVRKLVQVLEPHHSKEILEIADNIIDVQNEEKIVSTDERTFRNNTMLWILDHLLVERGTLFNTVAFVKSTLHQMALHHNIAFEALVAMVAEAVQKVENKQHFSTVFVQAVLLIGKEQKKVEQQQSVVAVKPNYWTELESLLTDIEERKVVDGREIHIAELFSSLAIKDAAQMRSLIMRMGQEEKTRKHLIAHLEEPELEQLIKTIEPSDASFVIAYAKHTVEATRSDSAKGYTSKTPALIWEVILAYLIVDRGSRFNKKEFLKRTILNLSAKHNLTYLSLLSLLTYQGQKTEGSVGIEPALIFLLNDLTRDELRSTKGKQIFVNGLLQAFRSYVNGDEPINDVVQFYLPAREKLINDLLQTEPAKVLAMLKQEPAPRKTAKRLTELLNNIQLRKLLAVAGDELVAVVQTVYELLTKTRAHKSDQWLHGDVQIIVNRLALEYLLENPASMARSELLWEYFVEGLSKHFLVPEETVAALIYSGMGVIDEGIEQQVQQTVFETSKRQVVVDESSSFHEVARQVLIQRGVLSGSDINPENILQSIARQPHLLNDIRSLVSKSAQKQLWDELFKDGYKFYGAMKVQLLKALGVATKLSLASRINEDWLEQMLWTCAFQRGTAGNHDALLTSVIKSISLKLNIDVLIVPMVIQNMKDGKLSDHVNWDKIVEQFEGKIAVASDITSAKEAWEKGLQNDINDSAFRSLLYHNLDGLLNYVEEADELEALTTRLAGKLDLKLFIASLAAKLSANDQKVIEAIAELRHWLEVALENRSEVRAVSFEKILAFVLYSWKRNEWNMKAVERFADDLIEEVGEWKTAPSNVAELSSWLQKKVTMKQVVAQEIEKDDVPAQSSVVIVPRDFVKDIAKAVLYDGQLPQWSGEMRSHSNEQLMQSMAQEHPGELVKVLSSSTFSEPAFDRLINMLEFADLATAIVVHNSNLKLTMTMLQQLYKVVPQIQIAGVSETLLQRIIYRKTINALQRNNWRALDPKRFLQELIWLLIRDYHLTNSKILNSLELHRHLLPSPMMMSLTAMLAEERQKQQATELPEQIQKEVMEEEPEQGTVIPVTNAGIVILQSFLPMLFERLGLIKSNAFVTPEAQRKAVHIIQFVATGQTTTEEHHLVLNKLLCGLPLSTPIEEGIELTEEEKKTCTGLIEAAIGYWDAIGDSSPDGFRGNWLIRNGQLTVQEDRFDLDVEKRSYDILLNKSPFTFSIIKHKWMDEPIHVSWSY